MIRPQIDRLATILLTVLCLCTPALAQDRADRLGVPGPLDFDGATYALSQSSEPAANYVKQEYLPAGQAPDSFTDMLLVERLSGADVATAAGAQIAALKQRKTRDKVANYAILSNKQTGQAILDFVISGKSADGRLVVEWNAYRYVPMTIGGDPGVVLFGVSHRAYGPDAAKAFLQGLTDRRQTGLKALAEADLPAVTK